MHLVKIVDSIAAVPTTRLNLSDGTIWRVTSFDAPPPRLRRSMSQNAMTDGGFVSSSQYEMRTITMTLFLSRSSQDENATQLQTLARELDRETNYLMYQPVGATKPVFFQMLRSDMTSVREVPTPGNAAQRVVEVEVLAEPFALGLRETLGPYTINNDPFHASNPMSVTLAGIKGDVPAPAIVVDTSAIRVSGVLAISRPALTFAPIQCESMTLGTDTTNPGGGPDAAMSGTGTNNYVRTSFATDATMVQRLTTSALNAARGRFRLFAIVRRSGSSSVITVRANYGTTQGKTVTLAATTARQLVDLGTFSSEECFPSLILSGTPSASSVSLWAARASGAETLDWDATFAIQPGWLAIWDRGAGISDGTSSDAVFDTEGGQIASIVSGTLGTSGFTSLVPFIGGLPYLRTTGGGQTLVYAVSSGASGHVLSTTSVIEVHYFPRYLYVRPATT